MPVMSNGVEAELPYPATAEGFGQAGGDPEVLRAGIMELSGGDLANVEFLLKWRLWRQHNDINPANPLPATQEAVDELFEGNFTFEYSLVEGKSWTVVARSKKTGNFWVAQDLSGINHLSLMPLGAETIDDFQLSEVITPEWADNQRLIPVSKGQSRGHFVIGFYRQDKLVGWFNAVTSEAVFLPQTPEVFEENKYLLERNNYYITEDPDAVRLIYRQEGVENLVAES
jgi:hypothetical protein